MRLVRRGRKPDNPMKGRARRPCKLRRKGSKLERGAVLSPLRKVVPVSGSRRVMPKVKRRARASLPVKAKGRGKASRRVQGAAKPGEHRVKRALREKVAKGKLAMLA